MKFWAVQSKGDLTTVLIRSLMTVFLQWRQILERISIRCSRLSLSKILGTNSLYLFAIHPSFRYFTCTLPFQVCLQALLDILHQQFYVYSLYKFPKSFWVTFYLCLTLCIKLCFTNALHMCKAVSKERKYWCDWW